ncbi:ATPase [Limnochorda pilosa]|uniref:ATPase n=2 Tax=Limnochorda pilosa TaxID=1555112 RepID=A0A0K2SK29_LIMPI|nr:ATPase [Limnochorda pilosa]
MNLLNLLERLEELIQRAPEVPLTGRAIVDADQSLELIGKIRAAIPEEIRRAEALQDEREDFLREAQAEADETIQRAEAYAARLVSDSEVSQRARQEAERIVADARREADQLRREADGYAVQVLSDLEGRLANLLEVVRNGRAELEAGAGRQVG